MTRDAIGPEAEERRGHELTHAEGRDDPAEEGRVRGDVDDLQERPHRAHRDRERHGREEHDHVADSDGDEAIFEVLFGLLGRYGILETFT